MAIATTLAAWACIGLAWVTADARFTFAFLVLAATAPFVALFCVVVERRRAAVVALVVSLAAPTATYWYLATRPSDWLS